MSRMPPPVPGVPFASTAGSGRVDPRFLKGKYLLRQKVLTLMGAKFHLYDEAGGLVLFAKQKAFKLKEDVRLFEDEGQTRMVMRIKARSILDFSAAYDVFDVSAVPPERAETDEAGERVGTLQRKGMSSLMRDEWQVIDAGGRPVATILEDSTLAALLRRFVDMVSLLFPQTFVAAAPDGRTLALYKQRFNPIVKKLEFDLSGLEGRADPRLMIAAGVMLGVIEGKQE